MSKDNGLDLVKQRLRELIDKKPQKSKEELENEEMEKFTELYTEWKGPEKTSETYKMIPKFYFKLPSEDEFLLQKLREESRAVFLQRRSRELLDNDELQGLWYLLDKHHTPPLVGDEQMINYEDFLKVAEEAGPKCSPFFSPVVFAKLLQNDPCGRVSIMQFFNYVMRKVWLHQTRIGLSLYDVAGQGYLKESDLENYILELIPTLPQLRDEDLPKDMQECNWFSAPSALRVYGQYLNLDKDHNGMLSKQELARVFQECLTYEGEMDYKTYLDFVLALENRKEPQALQYLFRLLDIENKGYLNVFDLNFFFRAIQEQMRFHQQDLVSFDDVKNEIFDMVKPGDPYKITLSDLIKCGQGDTVISILIDMNSFWTYENREVLVTDTTEEAEV
ncbi:hypothetical protein LSH36_8g01093 [Paralvinella palmiformis]|uniref:EF-hand domain-containing protein n=1 Tax=Paralvinella palmiformis TaxID=53620 RepID=A0AAD9KF36_9ANNE|nr:hypothetical protein LSH36_8g01093 [Paralvinella palmiformis]